MENLLLNEIYLHTRFSPEAAKLPGGFEGDLFLKYFNKWISLGCKTYDILKKVSEKVGKSENSASLLVIEQVGTIG